jgi:hypothetical protein
VGSVLALALAILCVDAGAPSWLPRGQPVDVSDQVVYGLRRVGEGYVYDDPRFEARVARDGVVTFKDKRLSFRFPFFPFLDKGARPKGPTLESTLRDYLNKGRRGKPEPEAAPAQPPPRKMVQSEVCPPSSPCYAPPVTNAIEVRGNFDLTDEIMRAHGKDPYAYEKARFLSSTFEFRIKMAILARKTDLMSSLAKLPERLDELWTDERYTPRERRRILYELWYETDRTPDGERAGRAIDDFIRRSLPCASPAGYTAEELEAFRRLHPDRPFRATADCERAAPK